MNQIEIKKLKFAEFNPRKMSEKDKIIDIFAGGGSALMAAEKMGRQCFAMEINERFCDAIIYKWEKLTKKRAKKL